MGIFDKLKADSVVIEKATDSLGGGGFGPWDTDTYPVTIKMAYVDYSKGGAMSVNFDLEDDNGKKLRSQQWVTSGDAKGNKHYYEDKRSGKQRPLPGYSLVDDICVLATDTPLFEQDTESRAVGIYDFTQRKEVPQQREVFDDLIGQRVILAVEKQIVDKNVQQPDGTYAPGGETKEINEVVKAFHEEFEVTVTEAEAGLREATFKTAWEEKNRGEVRNKAKGAAKGAPTAGAPAAAVKPAGGSLFG
ncbi:single strand DNA binding protein [Vibrio phage vB_VspP_pVa5]|uniref:Single-stranded DNA-binding protein n=1 Tax=Vibrio phage vB_VspP_pVa5 TaxID=1913109 RepID=A0A1J0GV41_9CAUD|nr:single strand DNA binding protein [Vibrio phage vB_VspP_pVa5]APC46045.1 single-stranded DNA-binding protein [Vibrio phage vB_VspP_pVa5]